MQGLDKSRFGTIYLHEHPDGSVTFGRFDKVLGTAADWQSLGPLLREAAERDTQEFLARSFPSLKPRITTLQLTLPSELKK